LGGEGGSIVLKDLRRTRGRMDAVINVRRGSEEGTGLIWALGWEGGGESFGSGDLLGRLVSGNGGKASIHGGNAQGRNGRRWRNLLRVEERARTRSPEGESPVRDDERGRVLRSGGRREGKGEKLVMRGQEGGRLNHGFCRTS